MRNEQLSQSEMVVSRARYAELQSMEFRHLGYVRAATEMGVLQQRHSKLLREQQHVLNNTNSAYHLGFLDALAQVAQLQSRMIEQTLDAHPGHDTTPGPFRKGQLCLVNRQGCYCLVIAREEPLVTQPDPYNDDFEEANA